MELEEFITKTLINITNGVKNANNELGLIDGKHPHFNMEYGKEGAVSFDIAVTVSEQSEKSKGGGIKVYVMKLNAQKENKDIQETVSRIKFKVNPNSTIK